MSFSAETFNKKLHVLQDTQESIVSISQWVLFHHRHSKDTARVWSLHLLSDPTMSLSKRLSLLHLCNDVVQRARRKNKPEFIQEYAAVLPSVLTAIYPHVDKLTQPKIDRLLAVWEERLVFSPEDIALMKTAIASSVALQAQPAKPAPAVSTGNPILAVSPDLTHLNNLFLRVNELDRICQANLTQLGVQLRTYLPQDPSASDALPVPKVYLAKLNMLEKFSRVSIANIQELQSIKQQIAHHLSSLARTVSDGIEADNTKVEAINQRLLKLESTREELRAMIPDSASDKHSSPAAENTVNEHSNDDDDDDAVPTYESDEDEEMPHSSIIKNGHAPEHAKIPLSIRKRELEDDGLTMPAKRVAFCEDVEIKEYDLEEGISPDPAATSDESQDTRVLNRSGRGNENDTESGIENGVSYNDANEATPVEGSSADIMDLLLKLS